MKAAFQPTKADLGDLLSRKDLTAAITASLEGIKDFDWENSVNGYEKNRVKKTFVIDNLSLSDISDIHETDPEESTVEND